MKNAINNLRLSEIPSGIPYLKRNYSCSTEQCRLKLYKMPPQWSDTEGMWTCIRTSLISRTSSVAVTKIFKAEIEKKLCGKKEIVNNGETYNTNYTYWIIEGRSERKIERKCRREIKTVRVPHTLHSFHLSSIRVASHFNTAITCLRWARDQRLGFASAWQKRIPSHPIPSEFAVV